MKNKLKFQSAGGQRGFTLLDVIFALVILAIGFAGIARMFASRIGSDSAGSRQATMTATQLAQKQLEQMAMDKAYRGYNYITSGNYPSSAQSLTSLGYTGWTRTTTIQEVSGADLTTPLANSGYKKITVTIAWPGGGTRSLSTLLTDWP